MSEVDELNISLCLVEGESNKESCLNFDNIDKIIEENNINAILSNSQEYILFQNIFINIYTKNMVLKPQGRSSFIRQKGQPE